MNIIQFIHKQYTQGKGKYCTNVCDIMIYHMQYSSTQVYILSLSRYADLAFKNIAVCAGQYSDRSSIWI